MESWKRNGIFIFFWLWICIFIVGQHYESKIVYKPPPPNNITNLKKILFYTPYFYMKDWGFGFGQEPFKRCPVSNCYTTNNRNLLNSISDFDAVFFHIRDMNKGQISLPKEKERNPNQFYTMFLMESPLNDNNFPYEKFQNYFNWTMTYRKNSDFYRPYGWIAPKNWSWHYPDHSAQQNWSQYYINSSFQVNVSDVKTKKPVAWLVSNCHTSSKREAYISELSNLIQVDIFGGCGSKKCPDDRCV